MKNTGFFALLVFAAMLSSCCGSRRSDGVKTTFQTSREWRPTIDNRADAAMVYGVGGNPSDNSDRIPFEERVRSWRERGYEVHFMTGIAWGEYQDYFTGAWDGVPHLDEGQVQRSGDTIWHGHMVPYIVPTDNYLEYMKQRHIKRVIDAGITHIFLEEPEFWARAGYSEAFKREWRKFYGFDWRPQHESPENTYLASKLKYHLYYNALREVCSFAKEYGRSKGLDVRCYVPTHSLVNYAQWQIVSPEASLASLPCVDGYIAQVWTGTSREPNYFDGVCRERVFETAFLEYGSMASMTAPTGRKMFFLTDPIEDWPRDWKDYKRNYQATFVAQLLYPGIADYEVMPWPERIYEGLYRTSPDSDAKERIPRRYSAQMQVMIGALHSMPRTGDRVSGSHGIAVAMSNSLMFQRFPRHDGYDDPQLANFYGLALPFVKRGVPVAAVHLENLAYPEALADTKVLLMTYSNMKPQEEASHEALARWVRRGGTLVYCGRDDDPFQGVAEWWNSGDKAFAAPADHLFGLLGIGAAPAEGTYACGKGKVCVLRQDPKEFVLTQGGDARLVGSVRDLYEELCGDGALEFKNHFRLSRGMYELVSVMEESVGTEPCTVEGTLIDLFDPQLPVRASVSVAPGEQALLIDAARVTGGRPQVLAAAYRAENEKRTRNTYSYAAKAPIGTTGVSRVRLPQRPARLFVDGRAEETPDSAWDEASRTFLLTLENNPDGVEVRFEW